MVVPPDGAIEPRGNYSGERCHEHAVATIATVDVHADAAPTAELSYGDDQLINEHFIHSADLHSHHPLHGKIV
jgi:hypothetical protein